MTTLADFTASTITGQDKNLADYVGSVALVVNTASKCGFTPQYAGLQDLYARFHERGLVVLGFPCDQFMHQEPGTESEIAEFCSVNFGVEFPMFAKVDVNGEDAHPLYTWLTSSHAGPHGDIPAGEIGWNFTKFLIGRDGAVIARYGPKVEPADIADDIERTLAADA
ncbi:glutathione peroxidase [Brachybacterium sp. GCM10030268]|uniref:glutathione peroxidase n=1 Tax=Brachybacterium sp. GCM10030268 TaxID=3273382 RepID=UPI003613F6A3